MVSATAIYLASKVNIVCAMNSLQVEEHPVELRDVVTTCFRVFVPGQPILRISSQYSALRESVVQSELVLLRILDFETDFATAHKVIYFEIVCI